MTLEEQYKKETNLEAYELDTLNNGYDNFKYIKWLEAKINYTRLKDKEIISFEEWLFVNNYKKLFDYFVKDAVSFTESELMQIYNDQVMNL